MEGLYQKKIQLGIACAILVTGFLGGYFGYESFIKMSPIVAEYKRVRDDKTSKPLFVASVRGEAYHIASCAGAKRINESNKIYFLSRISAEAAGYRPSKTCPEIFLFP